MLGGLALAVVLTVTAIVVTTREEGTGPSRAAEVVTDGPVRSGPLAAGESIPEFSAPGLAGGRVVWSDRAGTPSVLAIWAPWCPSCQKELPVLDRVVREFPEVSLLSIVTAIGDRPGPTPEGYLAANGLTFPAAVDDGAATLAATFGLEGFPTLYFVNADGTVARYAIGELSEEQLREAIGAIT